MATVPSSAESSLVSLLFASFSQLLQSLSKSSVRARSSTSSMSPRPALSFQTHWSPATRIHEFRMLLTAGASTSDSLPLLQLGPKTTQDVPCEAFAQHVTGGLQPQVGEASDGADGSSPCSPLLSLSARWQDSLLANAHQLGCSLRTRNKVPCSGGPPAADREDESDEDSRNVCWKKHSLCNSPCVSHCFWKHSVALWLAACPSACL